MPATCFTDPFIRKQMTMKTSIMAILLRRTRVSTRNDAAGLHAPMSPLTSLLRMSEDSDELEVVDSSLMVMRALCSDRGSITLGWKKILQLHPRASTVAMSKANLLLRRGPWAV